MVGLSLKSSSNNSRLRVFGSDISVCGVEECAGQVRSPSVRAEQVVLGISRLIRSLLLIKKMVSVARRADPRAVATTLSISLLLALKLSSW